MSTPLDATTVLESTITADPVSFLTSQSVVTVIPDSFGPPVDNLLTLTEFVAGVGGVTIPECPECPDGGGPVRPASGIVFP